MAKGRGLSRYVLPAAVVVAGGLILADIAGVFAQTPSPPPPTVRYSCVGGQCVVDANGQYSTLAGCMVACQAPPPARYSCVSGQCVPDASGSYASLAACQAVCQPPPPPPPPPPVPGGQKALMLDKASYSIGERVNFTSTGWAPGDNSIVVSFSGPGFPISAYGTSFESLVGIHNYYVADGTGTVRGSLTITADFVNFARIFHWSTTSFLLGVLSEREMKALGLQYDTQWYLQVTATIQIAAITGVNPTITVSPLTCSGTIASGHVTGSGFTPNGPVIVHGSGNHTPALGPLAHWSGPTAFTYNGVQTTADSTGHISTPIWFPCPASGVLLGTDVASGTSSSEVPVSA